LGAGTATVELGETSCVWHKADITIAPNHVRFRGVERTLIGHAAMSAYDPTRP